MLKTANKVQNFIRNNIAFIVAIGGIVMFLVYILFSNPDWSLTNAGINLGLITLGIIIIVMLVRYRRRYEVTLSAREKDLQKNIGLKKEISLAQEHMDVVFRVSRKLVESDDESEIINTLLQIAIETMGAAGASYVPLDDRNQPMVSINKGELPFPIMEAWIEYLASPEIRERCGACNQLGEVVSLCPLLNTTPDIVQILSNPRSIYCLPLRCEDRELGILNLYMPNSETIESDKKTFISVITDEVAMAIDRVRLRNKQLETLHKLHRLGKRTEIKALLTSLVDNVFTNLEADFVTLRIESINGQMESEELVSGELRNNTKAILDGLIQSVMVSGEPLLAQDVAGESTNKTGIKSIIAVPLVFTEAGITGVLLAGQYSKSKFYQRQIPVLKTIASHMVLVIQNAKLMAEIEYKTMIEERTRLAREIHDGLAQTLGLLKLQAAQMRNYLNQDDTDGAQDRLSNYYRTLSEAFHDAREAIDNLRIDPYGEGIVGWLSHVLREFQEGSGIESSLEDCRISFDPKPEVHAQLIRIVQEALSNVRKHAEASRVWVICLENAGNLVIEIRDDGKGFSPEYISSQSKHGLRGMQERAELINADFQIISHSNQGTTVRLELPMNEIEDRVI